MDSFLSWQRHPRLHKDHQGRVLLCGARGRRVGNPSTGLPTALKEVRIEQKLGNQLPLDLNFRDESGQQVKLGQYFGKKPVALALVYYDCPMPVRRS